jgi:hypothetical protein
VPYAGYDLSFGDFDHPSPGVGYAGIGTISPPLIIQFLDNGVDLWLKSLKPPVELLKAANRGCIAGGRGGDCH